MPEPGSRTPASPQSAQENMERIAREDNRTVSSMSYYNLKQALERAGLKGFRKGGRVKRTGIYKLHRGEHVTPARSRRRGRRR